MLEKFIVGTIIIIAVAKMAAIWDFTKLEISNPKAVEAAIANMAPKVIAHIEPFTGTSKITIDNHTIIK